MNERIKELLLKAGFTNAYSDPKEGFELVFVDEDHTTESVAKFAELIIRECADQVDDGDMEGQWARSVLYEHFGIKK